MDGESKILCSWEYWKNSELRNCPRSWKHFWDFLSCPLTIFGKTIKYEGSSSVLKDNSGRIKWRIFGKGWGKASQVSHTLTDRTAWLQWSSEKGSLLYHLRNESYPSSSITFPQHSLGKDFQLLGCSFTGTTARPCMVAGWLNLTDFRCSVDWIKF